MDVKEMRAKVSEELDHIPRHPKQEQGELRMAYQIARMHSLGKKAKTAKAASEVLHECLVILRKSNPATKYLYDEAFFGKPSKKGK